MGTDDLIAVGPVPRLRSLVRAAHLPDRKRHQRGGGTRAPTVNAGNSRSVEVPQPTCPVPVSTPSSWGWPQSRHRRSVRARDRRGSRANVITDQAVTSARALEPCGGVGNPAACSALPPAWPAGSKTRRRNTLSRVSPKSARMSSLSRTRVTPVGDLGDRGPAQEHTTAP